MKIQLHNKEMPYKHQIAQGLILPFIIGTGACSETGKKTHERPNIIVLCVIRDSI